jgi:hypothetical protein
MYRITVTVEEILDDDSVQIRGYWPLGKAHIWVTDNLARAITIGQAVRARGETVVRLADKTDRK